MKRHAVVLSCLHDDFEGGPSELAMNWDRFSVPGASADLVQGALVIGTEPNVNTKAGIHSNRTFDLTARAPQ